MEYSFIIGEYINDRIIPFSLYKILVRIKILLGISFLFFLNLTKISLLVQERKKNTNKKNKLFNFLLIILLLYFCSLFGLVS
ncbi:hypothetical protein [Blattabacterium sp. (Cryptocercus punctulatus) str. Cpu]|uniref:hypothetical protein n=1 Tax=Blattabacterium sp. (Cryptocercus punctulatus) str. Cpu TaxID=1075399 RepID=UPI0020A76FFF|nr:hypothetical protein [Blattabacterium sp. (Cryptocercus punctulatus) str. Cpu]